MKLIHLILLLLIALMAVLLAVQSPVGCRPVKPLDPETAPSPTATPPTMNVAPSGLRTVQMPIGGERFTLEVANTHASRQRGLMFRESMPRDWGMIFVFPDESRRQFWMRNTQIPLDIVYLDSAGRIVSIRQMRPFDETGVPSDGAARYAIELNQGTAQRLNLRSGQQLEIPAGARLAAE